MTRKVREANLEGTGNRAKLAKGVYHWRAVSQGRHIGYRRPEKEGGAGVWFARVIWRDEKGKHIVRKERLGIADDHLAANGTDILTFFQAQELAGPIFAQLMGDLSGEAHEVGPKVAYTIQAACDDYLKDYERRGGKSLGRTQDVIRCHITARFGEVELARLKQKMIEDWLDGIAGSGRKVKVGRGQEPKTQPTPEDADEKRARKATANRIWNVFRAILNFAHQTRKVKTDDAWSRIKSFRAVDAARDRFLGNEELTRLVNGAEPGFRELLCGGIHTGCRYGELVALKVKEVDTDNGTIFIPDSKSGKSKHVPLTTRGTEFFVSMVAGRKADEVVFLRANGTEWNQSDNQRPMARACQAAKIDYLSFYEASRHSYAANMVRLGVPLHVLAKALGHADSRMVVKHYGHLAPDFISKEIREKTEGIDLGVAQAVTKLKIKGA